MNGEWFRSVGLHRFEDVRTVVTDGTVAAVRVPDLLRHREPFPQFVVEQVGFDVAALFEDPLELTGVLAGMPDGPFEVLM